jgi:hypothetical protein
MKGMEIQDSVDGDLHRLISGTPWGILWNGQLLQCRSPCVPACPFTVHDLRSMMEAHNDEAEPDSQGPSPATWDAEGQEMILEPRPILFW